MRSLTAVLFVLGFAGLSRAQADDVFNLKGVAVPTISLKGTTANDAETIPVFHGRLFGCCGCGWGCCRREVVCCPPQPVCCPQAPVCCVDGFGGYAMAPAVSYGYAAAAPIAAPPPFAFAQPSPTYYDPAPSTTRAVVTLPRLGLSFTLGNPTPSTLASRSTLGNRSYIPPSPAEREPALPPAAAPTQPDQFRYDGGPATPVPLPGNTRTLPNMDPASVPSLNNRVKLAAAKPTWLAYGERPAAMPTAAPSALLVKTGAR